MNAFNLSELSYEEENQAIHRAVKQISFLRNSFESLSQALSFSPNILKDQQKEN